MDNTFTAEITEMNSLGNGITKKDGCVIFCLGCVDGDTVTAAITEQKKNFKIAEVLSVDKPSPFRCEQDCALNSDCGGCSLRHISYEHELDIKRKSIEAAFRRFGLGHISVDEIISGEPERYRNKAVFHFSKEKKLGYMAEKSHSFICVDDCLLCPASFSLIAHFTEEYFKNSKLDLTYLFLRTNNDGTELSVVIGSNDEDMKQISDYAVKLNDRFPSVVGVMLGSGKHPEENASYKKVFGSSYIETQFCNLNLKVSTASFFQVNYAAAELLCKKAAEMLAPRAGEYGADLYCGTGTIGMVCAMANSEAFVTGIEINEDAVRDAKNNAHVNKLSNVGFYQGDSADFVHSAYGAIDFAIIDPPRAGCSDKMIHDLIKLSPKRILAVSCSPETLGRDLQKLTNGGYKIEKVVACDLFPRTKHVECMVLLTSNKNQK